jgi:hypothetical protein
MRGNQEIDAHEAGGEHFDEKQQAPKNGLRGSDGPELVEEIKGDEGIEDAEPLPAEEPSQDNQYGSQNECAHDGPQQPWGWG